MHRLFKSLLLLTVLIASSAQLSGLRLAWISAQARASRVLLGANLPVSVSVAADVERAMDSFASEADDDDEDDGDEDDGDGEDAYVPASVGAAARIPAVLLVTRIEPHRSLVARGGLGASDGWAIRRERPPRA